MKFLGKDTKSTGIQDVHYVITKMSHSSRTKSHLGSHQEHRFTTEILQLAIGP